MAPTPTNQHGPERPKTRPGRLIRTRLDLGYFLGTPVPGSGPKPKKFKLNAPRWGWGWISGSLEGPQIHNPQLYPFAVCPNNAKCPRMGIIIGVRDCFVAQRALFFKPGPPGLRASPLAITGRRSFKNRGQIYYFIVPNVCPGIGGSDRWRD
jgi:hypothetical protein